MGLTYRNKDEMRHQGRSIDQLDRKALEDYRRCVPDALGDTTIFDYDPDSDPISQHMQDLLEAQRRGEVALCQAFRDNPRRSRKATDYPELVGTMASYFTDKMAEDIRQAYGREPRDLESLQRCARILARAWASGVLQRARL